MCSSFQRTINLSVSLPPQAELDCLALWCSLATIRVPFSFTILSMHVCPRLPKYVPHLAACCTINTFRRDR